jgi:hypothetical protein
MVLLSSLKRLTSYPISVSLVKKQVNDQPRHPNRPLKEVLAYPLVKRFRELLSETR